MKYLVNYTLYKFINYKLELNDYIIKNINQKPDSDVIQVEILINMRDIVLKDDEKSFVLDDEDTNQTPMEKNREDVKKKIEQYNTNKQNTNFKDELLVAAKKYIHEFDEKSGNKQDLFVLSKLKKPQPIYQGEENEMLLGSITKYYNKMKNNPKYKGGGKKTKKRKNYKQKNKSQKKN